MAHFCTHGCPVGPSTEGKMRLLQECDRAMVQAVQEIQTQAESPEALVQLIASAMVKAFSSFRSDQNHSHLMDGELSALYFARATDILLLGEPGLEDDAHIMAFLGVFFKEMKDQGIQTFLNSNVYVTSGMSRENAEVMAKILTHDGLVRYLAKTTPCSCLNDLKKEAKASPKMGKCHSCGKENTKMTLFNCSRCMIGEYCSKECQRADWKVHKLICNKLAKQKE